MPQRRESYLRIAETEDGNIAILVNLAAENDGDTLRVPFCDMLVLAMAKMLAEANGAITETMPEVHAAFEAMAKEENAVKAAELFNAAIGVPVYSVEPKQDNTP